MVEIPNIINGVDYCMANFKTKALSTEEYRLIIETIKDGFTYNGIKYKANNRIATVLVTQSNLGLRIGDTLKLKMSDIVKDGERYRLDIIEEKTQKRRTFTVAFELYQYLKIYMLENGIKPTAKLFDIRERVVQKHLKNVCDYLGLNGISTHSFRKYFATQIYINNSYDIALVKELLQHSSVLTTQRYLTVSSAKVEEALNKHIQLL